MLDGALSIEALRLGVLISAALIWLLARNRNFFLRRLSNYPILSGICDALIVVLIGYSLQGLLFLLGALPRMSNWASTTEIAGRLAVHLGYAWGVARLVESLIRKRRSHSEEWRLPGLAWIGLYTLFALLGILSFLVAEGNALTELFVWTGATAAVLAFVMQQTLGDLFSGFALTIERPFDIGDWLRLEDGTEGQVQDINWRATHLRKWDKTEFVIPNGQLANQSFTNLRGNRHPFAPWYTVKVAGDHAPEDVIALIRKAVYRCNIPLPSPEPVVRLMSADSTPYTYMIWVHFADYPTMFAGRDELYREVDSQLRNAGITISAQIHDLRHSNSKGAISRFVDETDR